MLEGKLVFGPHAPWLELLNGIITNMDIDTKKPNGKSTMKIAHQNLVTKVNSPDFRLIRILPLQGP